MINAESSSWNGVWSVYPWPVLFVFFINDLSDTVISFCDQTSWSGIGSWPSDRGIKSQGNMIILRDLTQECRKNL